MTILKPNGSRPSGSGSAEHFTGAVHIDPLFQSPGPATLSGASITFEPDVRSARRQGRRMA